MKIFQIILVLLWRIWFILINIFLVIIFGGGSIPFLLIKKKYRIAYWFHQIWGRSNLFLMGFRYEVDRDEILNRKQSYMIIANHTSIMDIMLIYTLMKNHPLVFVGKSELSKIPIFGYVYSKSNVLVNRKSNISRIQVIKKIQKQINDGKSICMFPEGGVPNPSFFLSSFKNGPFAIAINQQIPIVAFTIEGMKEQFPHKLTKGYPGKIRVKQHYIIQTKGLTIKDKINLKKECYELIYSQLRLFQKNNY